MSNHSSKVSLTIAAATAGLERIEAMIAALRATGAHTEQLEVRAQKLRESWDSLPLEEQARELHDLAQHFEQAQNSARAHEEAIQDHRPALQHLQEGAGQSASALQRLQREGESGAGIFQRFRGALIGFGAALAGAFALHKIKDFFQGAVSEAAAFERQMQVVAAVSGASSEEWTQLAEKAKAMGASTQYSATEAAQALENLMRAGLSCNDAMEALAPTLALAQGNGLSLATAATLITQSASGMALSMNEAGRVADVLAKAASHANTNVEGLASGLSYAAPSARAMGLSLEETVAYLGKFADAGIDGSRAGTVLNNMLAQFANRSSTFTRELHHLGIRSHHFSEALKQLAEKGEAGNRAIQALGLEAAPAFKALAAQGFEALDGLTIKLENAGGSAQQQAQTMDRSVTGAFAGLSSAWSALKLALAEPILQPLAEKMREISAWFSELLASGKVQKLGERIAQGFSQAADKVLNFAKSLDFGAIIDKISAKIDKWSQSSERLGFVFTALNQSLSVAHILLQGLAAGLTTVIAVTMEALNGIALFAAKMARAFAWVTDKIGLSTNAVHTFDDAIRASSDNVGHYMQEAAVAIEKNRHAILESAQSILGMQTEQTEALTHHQHVTEQLAAVEAERSRARIHDAEVLQKVHQNELEALNARQQKEQEALQEQAAALERSKSAFSSAGLDFEALLTGVSSQTRQTFAHYAAAVRDAMAAGVNATQLARAGFEQLAANIDSPQAWQALRDQISSVEGGMEQLTQGQLKRLEEGIQGLPHHAKTAMEELSQALKKVDASGLNAFKNQLESAFKAGEISASQYNQLLHALQQQTEALQAETAAYGETAQRAHQQAQQAAQQNIQTQQALALSQEQETTQTQKITQVRQKLYDATNLNAEAQAKLNQLSRDYVDDLNRFFILGSGVAHDLAYRNRQLVEYANQLRDVQAATEALNAATEAGTVTMDDINHATYQAQRALFGLDATTLNHLNEALDRARQKLADMKQEAEGTRASLEAQLASLRGDDRKAQALKEEAKLRALNAKIQEAERKGQKEIAQTYRQALELQKALFVEERKRLASDAAEGQHSDARQPQLVKRLASDAAEGQHSEAQKGRLFGAERNAFQLEKPAPLKPQRVKRLASDARFHTEAAIEKNAPLNKAEASRFQAGGELSASELAQVWDDKIEAAKKAGAMQFAQELYQKAKRQPR